MKTYVKVIIASVLAVLMLFENRPIENGIFDIQQIVEAEAGEIEQIDSISFEKSSLDIIYSATQYTFDKTTSVDYTGARAISITSSNPDVASAELGSYYYYLKEGTVKITQKSIGQTTITITTENGATASCVVNVNKRVYSINLDATNVHITLPKADVYDTSSKKYTVNYSGDEVKSVSSSNTSVADVRNNYYSSYSKTGSFTITGEKAGSCVITVKAEDGTEFYCNVIVEAPKYFIQFEKEVVEIDLPQKSSKNKYRDYDYYDFESDGEITYVKYTGDDIKSVESSSTSVVEVQTQYSKEIKLKAKAQGLAIITAKAADGTAALLSVYVYKNGSSKVSSLPSTSTIENGKTMDYLFSSEVAPINEVSSSDSSIAEVKNTSDKVNGLPQVTITAKQLGTVDINVSDVKGKRYKTTLKVEMGDFSVDTSEVNLELGGKEHHSIKITNGKLVSVSVADKKIVRTVFDEGNDNKLKKRISVVDIYAEKKGNTTVTLTDQYGRTINIGVTVKIHKPKVLRLKVKAEKDKTKIQVTADGYDSTLVVKFGKTRKQYSVKGYTNISFSIPYLKKGSVVTAELYNSSGNIIRKKKVGMFKGGHLNLPYYTTEMQTKSVVIRVKGAYKGDTIVLKIGDRIYSVKVKKNIVNEAKALNVPVARPKTGAKISVVLKDKYGFTRTTYTDKVYYSYSIWVGMTKQQLVQSTFGYPDRRNDYGSFQQWVYEYPDNEYWYIYFENGRIVSWDHMNY